MAFDSNGTPESEDFSDDTHFKDDDDIELMLLARRRGRKCDTSAAFSPIKVDD